MPCLPNAASLGGPTERGGRRDLENLCPARTPPFLSFSLFSLRISLFWAISSRWDLLWASCVILYSFPPLPSPSLRVPWARGTGEWRPCATGTPDCGTSCGEVPGPLFSPFNFPGFRIRRGGRRRIILRQRSPRRLCRLSSPACGRRKPRDRI